MVLSPKEVSKSIEKGVAAQVKAHERHIDEALKKAFSETTGSHVWLAATLLGTAHIKEELLRRYRAAGWHIEYVSDQREGDAYKFSTRRPNG